MKNNNTCYGIILCCALFSLLFFSKQTNAQTNAALGRPVTASGVFDATNQPLSMLTDGITTAANWTGTNNLASSPNVEWFQIDLGSDQVIENIRIIPRSGQEARGQRFMIVTWPSAVGASLGDVPGSYVGTGTNISNFNRLIYTNATNVTSANPFGSAAVPEAANVNLGPAYTQAAPLNINIGIHEARYIRLLTLQDTHFDLSEVQVFTSIVAPQRDFNNGSFEQGSSQTAVSFAHEADVNGWSTTEAVAMTGTTAPLNSPANGGLVEFWNSASNPLSLAANAGNYFVELNAYTNGSLNQEPICVMANESFTWSFAHRGRSGVDVMNLRINDVDVAQFSDNNAATGTHTGVVLAGGSATTTITSTVAEANGWTQYTGTWLNNTASSQTVIFAFSAVSTSSGNVSVGNFIDDVSLVTLNPLIKFNASTSTGPETTPTANLPVLLVSGTIPAAGSSIQLNITGGTATRGVDYTTVPASGPITINLPGGTVYDGTAATAISLAPYIQVNVDAVFAEGPETINMELINPVRMIVNSNVACTQGVSNNVYTITEATTLPVILTSFKVKAANDDCSANLDWTTGSEINFSHFEMEVSKDGNSFEKIGTLTASGNEAGSQYHFNTPVTANLLYFRLKMVDKDRQFELSDVAVLRSNCNKVLITLSPNPAKGIVTLKGIAKNDIVRIYDAAGKLVMTTKTSNDPSAINLSGVSNGTYTVTVLRNNKQIFKEQLIKN